MAKPNKAPRGRARRGSDPAGAPAVVADTQGFRGLVPPTYFELRERLEVGVGWQMPEWSALLAEQNAICQQMRDGVYPWSPFTVGSGPPERYASLGSYRWPEGPAEFDLHNLVCFSRLDGPHKRARMLWRKMKRFYTEQERVAASGAASALTERELASLEAYGTEAEREEAFMQETLHWSYHWAMWRRFGRRVYVLDDTMAHLLARTTLPALPASLLWAPHPSFYITLPRGVFRFCVPGDPVPQDVAGIGVSTDAWEPDSGRQRELSLFTTGTDGVGGQSGFENANIAYMSVGLGTDALLSDIRFQGMTLANGQRGALWGDEELAVVVPRIVVGLLLYLTSEHPDIEPIAPPPRRDLTLIANPGKRRKAEGQDRRQTKLGYIMVGRREGIAAQREELRVNGAGGRDEHGQRRLDHQVWVRGHWRMQAYGERRALRRPLWIRPFVRGPDMAESIAIRAAKVQAAKPKGARP